MEDKKAFLIGILLIFASNSYYYISKGLVSLLEPPNYYQPGSDSPILKGKYNDDLYTRGKIHYLTMDHGMKSSCWNETLKPLLQLTCPTLLDHPKIELEMAFYLTSCFCESIGKSKLQCEYLRNPKEYENEDGYVDQLIDCAEDQCYNTWNHDGFESVTERMHDLCYFVEYESQHDEEFRKPYVSIGKLYQLQNIVQGNIARKEPRLYYSEQQINGIIESVQKTWSYWIHEQKEEFWRNLDDAQFVIKENLRDLINMFYYSEWSF